MATDRFAFGANWAKFLPRVDSGLEEAERSLTHMLGDLRGKTFLDVGSGSGMFSLAAHNLGARVHSFDYDADSVACTKQLAAGRWPAEQGSVLDRAYLASLGKFDIVYSWGVLHHTGNLWQACGNVAGLATEQLYVAIYNDQGWKSRYWRGVKKAYNANAVMRSAMTFAHLPLPMARVAVRALTGRLNVERGMSIWRDYIDWVGGYPFEVAEIRALSDFFLVRGWIPNRVVNVGDRQGCNEIAFVRNPLHQPRP